MIVEFVGPPGVGKTAISRALSERFQRKGNSAAEPTFDDSQRPGRVSIRQFRFAAWLFFRHPILTARWFRSVVAGRLAPMRRLITRALDLLYSCAVTRQCVRPGWHILDQGVLQSVSSVRYFSRSPTAIASLVDLADALYDFDARIFAVFVDAAPGTVMTRLRERPGKRTMFERLDSPAEFADTISRLVASVADAKQLAAMLEDRLGDRFTVISISNGPDISVESVADELYDRLAELACPSG